MSGPKLPKLPLVLVVWDDASFDHEPVTEESVDGVHHPTIVSTLGWVLRDNERGMTVVTEFYDGSYRGRTFIPRAMIQDGGVHVFALRKKAKEAKKDE